MKHFQLRLTRHARERIQERTLMADSSLPGMIRDGATLVIGMFSSAMYTHHLFYSPADSDYFTAVVTLGGEILTVMPESFLQSRITVTKAQKRGVRSRAIAWLKKTALEGKETIPSQKQLGAKEAASGWKVVASYSENGRTVHKSVGRTLSEHGSPQSWDRPGAVHDWLKQRIDETGIPIHKIHGLRITKNSADTDAFHLLEHLPMSAAEIAACA